MLELIEMNPTFKALLKFCSTKNIFKNYSDSVWTRGGRLRKCEQFLNKEGSIFCHFVRTSFTNGSQVCLFFNACTDHGKNVGVVNRSFFGIILQLLPPMKCSNCQAKVSSKSMNNQRTANIINLKVTKLRIKKAFFTTFWCFPSGAHWLQNSHLLV